jgi:ribosome modulation factor
MMEFLCPAALIFCMIAIALLAVAGISEAIKGYPQEQQEGRTAALNGLPPQSCPYGDSHCGATNEKEAWMRGWQQGAMELRNGGKKQ